MTRSPLLTATLLLAALAHPSATQAAAPPTWSPATFTSSSATPAPGDRPPSLRGLPRSLVVDGTRLSMPATGRTTWQRPLGALRVPAGSADRLVLVGGAVHGAIRLDLTLNYAGGRTERRLARLLPFTRVRGAAATVRCQRAAKPARCGLHVASFALRPGARLTSATLSVTRGRSAPAAEAWIAAGAWRLNEPATGPANAPTAESAASVAETAAAPTPTPTPTPVPTTTPAALTPPSTGSPGTTSARTQPWPLPAGSLGLNLSHMADWSTELPFVDAMRMSRVWSGPGCPSACGFTQDADGWIRSVTPGSYAETWMYTYGGNPAGRYHVEWQGTATIELTGNGVQVVERSANGMQVNVPANAALRLRVTSTNPSDPLRDLHVVLPGFASTFRSEPFHPLFLERVRRFGLLRYLNWQKINAAGGQYISTWASRPRPEQPSYAWTGVPLEVIVDLANRTGTHPWIHIPHQATADYIEGMAQLLRDRLDPRLVATVEWSNEVWNGLFPQTAYARTQGAALGTSDAERMRRYYGQRLVEIDAIFRSVYGDAARRARVNLVNAGQTGNTGVISISMGVPGVQAAADSIATAPYFGCQSTPGQWYNPGHPSLSAATRAMTYDAFAEQCRVAMDGTTFRAIDADLALAQRFGKPYLGYEGGQHLLAVDSTDTPLVDYLRGFNASPQMGDLYRRYLDGWQQRSGGGALAVYSYTAWPTPAGSFGLLTHGLQDPVTPKWAAVWERVTAMTP